MQIDGHTRQGIGLLATVATLCDEMVDHIEQGVPSSERHVFRFVAVLSRDRHTCGGKEALWQRRAWISHSALKLRTANATLRRDTLAHPKAHREGRSHLHGGTAALTITLGKMAITGGEQGSEHVYWQ